MSTATVTKPPAHVDSLMQSAHEMGWEVVCTPTSVKLTPPSGRKGDEIRVGLNPPPAPPQLNKTLADRGFLKARSAWEQEHRKNEVPPNFPCPECAADGKEDVSFTRASALGSHRRKVHGIEGGRAKKAASAAPETAVKRQAPLLAVVPDQQVEVPPVLTEKPEPEAVVETPRYVAVLAELNTAVTGEIAALQRENQRLQETIESVAAEAGNGDQAPVRTVANILTLLASAGEVGQE